MKIMIQRFTLLAVVALPIASASGLRRRLTQATECTLQVVASSPVPNVFSHIEDSPLEEEFECEMDPADMGGIPGLTLPIQASADQIDELKQKFKSGEIIAGQSKLKHGSVNFGPHGIELPPGLQIAIENNKHGRKLGHGGLTGDKPFLVVRVTDKGGKVRPESAAEIGDDVFGTLGDPLNLKSQMDACSFGQLKISEGYIAPEHRSAPGVLDVTIDVSLRGNDRYTIRNAVTTAAVNKLGHALPGPYKQVIYVLEDCYSSKSTGETCSWSAYAYINHWSSVFRGAYYKHVAVLMHELGHNYNMGHSGGLSGYTYSDHTGYMGNPCYADDFCAMCFVSCWALFW